VDGKDFAASSAATPMTKLNLEEMRQVAGGFEDPTLPKGGW
jgi:hypothetical protein